MRAYFLDTNALAKLYHPETGSGRIESLVQASSARVIISQLSLIEIQSVFAAKVRTGVIDKAALAQLRGRFFADLAGGDAFQLLRRLNLCCALQSQPPDLFLANLNF